MQKNNHDFGSSSASKTWPHLNSLLAAVPVLFARKRSTALCRSSGVRKRASLTLLSIFQYTMGAVRTVSWDGG